jgi:hypothetical protein
VRAVVVDLDVLEERRAGATGPDAAEFALEVVERLLHALFRLEEDRVEVHRTDECSRVSDGANHSDFPGAEAA